MIRKSFVISIFITISCLHGFSQITLNNLHYRSKIENAATYFDDNVKNHSSILPQIQSYSPPENNGQFTFSKSLSEKNLFKIYPLTDLQIGFQSSNKTNSNLIYTGGYGAGLDYHSEKLFFTGKIISYATQSGYVADSIQKTIQMDVGGNRKFSGNFFQQYELMFAYRPHKIFTFIGGQGRNTFGEGYRSLILSDNASSNPFFKIETAFSNIKYVNLYQMWNDNSIDPTNKSLDKRKFAAMHYISWNITREFNLSIFETVIWQSNDTLVNRGFDVNYLNPVVFYRPVEYGSGSADNVLLGANMSFKFSDQHSIYTQVILDDFLIAEIRAQSRWWANKYGFQFGYKSLQFLNKKDLYFQAEFNLVRPFTYSHKTSTQSYGNLNQSVAHPIGANFFELLSIVSYKIDKYNVTNKLTYSSYGVDSSGVSYGQNIFVPYGNRDGEYDHLITQGFKKNVLNETLILEMPLFKEIDLYANVTYNWRIEFTPIGIQNNHALSIGIRSRIWNRYTDF